MCIRDRLEGLKFKSCSTSSGERTSGKVFDDFGAVTSSKGDELIRLFFFKNLKNPFADDKCLWILLGLLFCEYRSPIHAEQISSLMSE